MFVAITTFNFSKSITWIPTWCYRFNNCFPGGMISGSFSSLLINSSTVDSISFVDQTFFLTLAKCPIDVWVDFVRCLLALSTVIPGNDVNHLLLIVFINVETGGELNTACWYIINSAFVRWLCALWNWWWKNSLEVRSSLFGIGWMDVINNGENVTFLVFFCFLVLTVAVTILTSFSVFGGNGSLSCSSPRWENLPSGHQRNPKPTEP